MQALIGLKESPFRVEAEDDGGLENRVLFAIQTFKWLAELWLRKTSVAVNTMRAGATYKQQYQVVLLIDIAGPRPDIAHRHAADAN